MNHILDKSCRECPFRRDSIPGYLGDNEPRALAAECLASERPMGCHLSVNAIKGAMGLETANATAIRCHGAAVFRGERPAESNIITDPAEFIAHHESGAVRSWEGKAR